MWSDSVPHRQPFVHGYADQLAGRGFLDNPYVQDSNDFRIWIDGYVKAMQHRGERMSPAWLLPSI